MDLEKLPIDQGDKWALINLLRHGVPYRAPILARSPNPAALLPTDPAERQTLIEQFNQRWGDEIGRIS